MTLSAIICDGKGPISYRANSVEFSRISVRWSEQSGRVTEPTLLCGQPGVNGLRLSNYSQLPSDPIQLDWNSDPLWVFFFLFFNQHTRRMHKSDQVCLKKACWRTLWHPLCERAQRNACLSCYWAWHSYSLQMPIVHLRKSEDTVSLTIYRTAIFFPEGILLAILL